MERTISGDLYAACGDVDRTVRGYLYYIYVGVNRTMYFSAVHKELLCVSNM